MANDLGIILSAKIDQSSKAISDLNIQIKQISDKLNKIDLKINIDDKLLSNLNKSFSTTFDQLNKLQIAIGNIHNLTGKDVTKRSIVKVDGSETKIITDMNVELGKTVRLIQDLKSKKNITITTVDNKKIEESKNNLDVFKDKYISILNLLQQNKKLGSFVDVEHLNTIKAMVSETSTLDKVSKQYIDNEIKALRQKATTSQQVYKERLNYEQSLTKTIISNEEKVRKELNKRMQGALGLGVKFENLSPESTRILETQLSRYKQIIKSFQEKNQLGIIVSDKELTKIQNLENRIKRFYESTKISLKDSQGFDFSQYPKMENGIKNIANAQEYYNQSIIKGKKLLEANVAETDKYIKVSQRLRDGSQIQNITAYINKATGETHKFSESMKDLYTRTYDLGSSFKTAFEKIGLWAAATGIFYGVANSLQQVATTIIEIDTRLTELSKVLSNSTDWSSLMGNTVSAATDFGRTISQTLESEAEFAKQGYEAAQAVELARSALLGANVTGMQASDVADRLTGALAQFNLTAEDSVRVIDKVNEVDNNFAVTSVGLMQGLQKAGETAQQFGVDLDTLIGYITAVSTATRESGNVIGIKMLPNMVTY